MTVPFDGVPLHAQRDLFRRLVEGDDPRELEGMFTGWNARLTPDGRIVPEISPV